MRICQVSFPLSRILSNRSGAGTNYESKPLTPLLRISPHHKTAVIQRNYLNRVMQGLCALRGQDAHLKLLTYTLSRLIEVATPAPIPMIPLRLDRSHRGGYKVATLGYAHIARSSEHSGVFGPHLPSQPRRSDAHNLASVCQRRSIDPRGSHTFVRRRSLASAE